MSFTIKIPLPSGKSIRIPELKNNDYFTILKYCENRDIEGLNNFFNFTFFTNDAASLDIIDKFYILLTIRMLFIDPELTFTDKTNSTLKISINNILEKIEHIREDFDITITADLFELNLGLPTRIYFSDLNDIYTSVIKTVRYKNKVIDFTSLSNCERDEVLSNLPNTLFPVINKYITKLSDNLKDFVVLEQNTQFNIQEIKTNIISNQFMGLVMSIFTTGLKNFLETIYVFTNRIKMDLSSFYDLTPIDSKVLINIYNKDIEAQNKELQMNMNRHK